MKIKSLLLLAATMLALNVHAEVGDTFTAMTAENVEMTFKIISEDDLTVMVGDESGSEDVSINHLTEGSITIPATVEHDSKTYQVVELGFRAFAGCSNLTSVTLPASVTSFRPAAFYNCTSLTSVNIPQGITLLAEDDFKNCEALTNITLPSTLTGIAEGVFCGCNNLTSVTVNATTPPSCAVSTSNPVFSNAANATLHVPSGTGEAYAAAEVWNTFKEIIDPVAFIQFEDAAVKSICVSKWDTNGDGELSYEEAAVVTDAPLRNSFANNQLITSFNEFRYFTSYTSLDTNYYPSYYGISNSKNLASIAFPEGMEEIPNRTIHSCDKLQTLYIPKSLKTLFLPRANNNIFISDLKAWTEMTLGFTSNTIDEERNIGKLYLNGELIVDLIIPEGITKVANFKGCKEIRSVTFPTTVTKIASDAFQNCYDGIIAYFKSSTPLSVACTSFSVIIVPDEAVD